MRLPRPTIPKFRLTFSKVLAGTAVVLVTTTGVAYAANTIGSDDIIDNTIKSQDVKDGALGSVDLLDGNVKTNDLKDGGVKSVDLENESILTGDILNGQVRSADIRDDDIASIDILDGTITSADVLDETLTAADLGSNSVGQLEIQTDGVAATEIADNTIDSGEIIDFQLSNQDISVLTAEVSAAGVLDNQCPGCGVSVIKLGVGQYEVDFARVITACTSVATVGPSGSGSAAGEINVADRGGNVEAVFVDTNDSAGTSADRPFRLVVVC